MAHRTRHHWTEAERDIVRRDYQQTHRSARDIGAGLGVSEFAVQGMVHRLGIAKRVDRRSWSDAEDEVLRELMEQLPATMIAKRMHRSIDSVVVRSTRLGISRRTRSGWYTKQDVCQILGVDHHWLQRRIDSGALRATYHNGRRPQRYGLAMWHIAEKDLRAYIRRYPEELNARNLDMVQIVDILAGVQEVKRRDNDAPTMHQ